MQYGYKNTAEFDAGFESVDNVAKNSCEKSYISTLITLKRLKRLKKRKTYCINLS